MSQLSVHPTEPLPSTPRLLSLAPTIITFFWKLPQDIVYLQSSGRQGPENLHTL